MIIIMTKISQANFFTLKGLKTGILLIHFRIELCYVELFFLTLLLPISICLGSKYA